MAVTGLCCYLGLQLTATDPASNGSGGSTAGCAAASASSQRRRQIHVGPRLPPWPRPNGGGSNKQWVARMKMHAGWTPPLHLHLCQALHPQHSINIRNIV
ncbi:hypothetical protein E2562_018547 [Oryza meyeriana var. granulata]|uniref:Uncharacterized protein n=1 Tax=Oryza meyeriana var. granulata TaxID=110450 RepID=A0A6G1F9C9_9ORYZ|nr:hypothetical protein E2562_018547 [Oryza meyeriana var. granulata]